MQKRFDLLLNSEMTPNKVSEVEKMRKELENSQKKLNKEIEIARMKEQISEIESTLENKYFCPITHSVFIDPVLADDGFTYEREYIEDWLKSNDASPMTNEKLKTKNIIPNRHVKTLVNDLTESLHSLKKTLEDTYILKE